ncbi:hypothetical protein [Ectopseudomonas composti]|uniref:hypothetical protein n=1 Tax=Ectopseudomonas composti TaxID=658457 RepID=UPI000B276C34|nr:hypothetical protein [Pseudomonas composti]
MPSYEQLKSELLEISKVIEKFPEAVKPKVYDLLVGQFLGHEPSVTNSNSSENQEQPASTAKKTSTN